MVRPCFALHAGPRARAHSHPPQSPPARTHAGALPCLSSSRWARARTPHAPAARGLTVRDCARWGRGGSRCRRRALLPSPGVPRPGRLCPMRRGVAGRWGVFLFWVEVEALERTELATGSRRGRGRRGRWWRPCGTRAVCPPRPTGGPRVTAAAASRSRNSRACPGPCLCTPHAAEPCPGRTRWPHEEGRERSDQEQV